MIAGLDSATPPTLAQVMAAKAAGYRIWSGYLSTAPFDGKPHFNLARPWSRAEFEIARQCGETPIAYASGQDDAGALKALAKSWNLRLALDNEAAIRADGPWVPTWLATASAGHYGNWQLHVGRPAVFDILAAYPTSGDPAGTSWWTGSPRPSGPCGWQWAGSHNFAGVTVDSSWFDDWFGGALMLSDDAVFGLGHLIVSALYRRPATSAEVTALGLKPDLSNLAEVVQAVENNVVNPKADVFKLQNTTLRQDLDAKSGGLPPSFDATITPR